jgi:hypothetical protein
MVREGPPSLEAQPGAPLAVVAPVVMGSLTLGAAVLSSEIGASANSLFGGTL